MKYLPSTTWLLAVAMPVLALGAISLLFYSLHGVDGEQSDLSLLADAGGANAQLMREVIEQDTDQDGLRDWEEDLWKTDRRRTDSDGDGTTDGDEVAAGRDPARPGPNDTANEAPFPSPTPNATSSPQYATITQKTAQDLFTGYLLLRQSNALSSDSMQNLVSQVVSSNPLSTKPLHTLGELRVVDSSEPAIIAQYRIDLRGALEHFRTKESEMATMQRLLQLPSPEDYAALQRASEEYRTAANTLLGVSVPIAVQNEHLVMVNSLEQYADTLQGMLGYSDDPMLAMLYMQKIIPLTESMHAAGNAIAQFLTASGVAS